MASGSSANSSCRARAVPSAVTGIGDEPVVSTPMPTIRPARSARFLEGAADGGGHRIQIVGRVVPELLARGIAVLLFAPSRVVGDGLGDFLAVGHAHHHRTNGVGSEIQPDYEILVP